MLKKVDETKTNEQRKRKKEKRKKKNEERTNKKKQPIEAPSKCTDRETRRPNGPNKQRHQARKMRPENSRVEMSAVRAQRCCCRQLYPVSKQAIKRESGEATTKQRNNVNGETEKPNSPARPKRTIWKSGDRASSDSTAHAARTKRSTHKMVKNIRIVRHRTNSLWRQPKQAHRLAATKWGGVSSGGVDNSLFQRNSQLCRQSSARVQLNKCSINFFSVKWVKIIDCGVWISESGDISLRICWMTCDLLTVIVFYRLLENFVNLWMLTSVLSLRVTTVQIHYNEWMEQKSLAETAKKKYIIGSAPLPHSQANKNSCVEKKNLHWHRIVENFSIHSVFIAHLTVCCACVVQSSRSVDDIIVSKSVCMRVHVCWLCLRAGNRRGDEKKEERRREKHTERSRGALFCCPQCMVWQSDSALDSRCEGFSRSAFRFVEPIDTRFGGNNYSENRLYNVTQAQ